MTDDYDEAYFKRMRGQGEGKAALYGRFLALLGQGPLAALTVLDLGCGRGELLQSLAEAGVGGLYGIDFSPVAVAESRRCLLPFLGAEEAARRVRQGSAADPSLLPGQSCDAVFMMDVVEHLPPAVLAQALANVRHWLKPGGELVIHTFPTRGPHLLYRAWLLLKRDREALLDLDRIHCNTQTRRSLLAVAEGAGLGCRAIWLQNDLALTSSAFQRLPEGMLKRALGLLFNDLCSHPLVQFPLRLVGLAEFVAPSIYARLTPKGDPP